MNANFSEAELAQRRTASRRMAWLIGAVGWRGFQDYVAEEPLNGAPAAVLETAHPAKMPGPALALSKGNTGYLPCRFLRWPHKLSGCVFEFSGRIL